jgi:hypothetical protein
VSPPSKWGVLPPTKSAGGSVGIPIGNIDGEPDRGFFPRAHGPPWAPLNVTVAPVKRLIPPCGRYEPYVLDGRCNDPKRNNWRKVRKYCRPTGIMLSTPLQFTHVRFLYQVSTMLNSFLQVVDQANLSKENYTSARRLFFSIKAFVETLDYSPGSVIDSALRIGSIRLRSAKTELRSAGCSFKLSH